MEKNQVLAVVGGREISQEDMEFLYRSLDPQTAMQFRTESGKARLLQELVNQELFYLDAVNTGMDQDPEYKAEEEKMKVNLLKQFAINRLLKDVGVSEKEAEAYYNENKNRFVNPGSVKASHILTDDAESARKVLDEINAGLSFEDAAQKYSKCPSKENGGDLGYFSRGRMVPEFENSAFNMEKGDISSPVKTQFGYHIIKLFDKKEPETLSFGQVRDKLVQQLTTEKQQNLFLTKVDELKTKYPVKICT